MHRAFPKISGFIGKLKALSLYGVGVIAILWSIVVPAGLVRASIPVQVFPSDWTAYLPMIPFLPATNGGITPLAVPQGLSPQQIAKAYGINQLASRGTGKTIAIIDAYGSPTITSDLTSFDTQFGLPAANLTVAYPGGTPQTNSDWAIETDMDVEWAHAIAPAANILLVVAPSSSGSDLINAINYATGHGANLVSMSWGGPEFSGETGYDSYFNNSGVTYLASSGDSGEGISWPAVSPYVVGVGGTVLNLNADGSYGSEMAWSGSGGGKSAYETEPSYQSNFQSSAYREVPDVAFDAATGVAVYSSQQSSRGPGAGWQVWGGTSLSAPCWAGLFALGGLSGVPSLYSKAATVPLYANNYHDITTGNNGLPASAGYDEVTGLGSPKANNLVPGAANQLSFITQPSSSNKAGVAFGTQPAVAVEDINGNTVTASIANVTLAIASGMGTNGAKLSGATTVSAVNGVANFSGLSINLPGTGYALTATSSGLTQVMSATVIVSGAEAVIQGTSYGANGVILGGVTLTLDGTTQVTSSSDGTYQLVITAAGSHTIVATGTGYRSQTQTINVTDVTVTYPLDFKGNNGLVPNAPNVSFVLTCINKWKYPPSDGTGLSISKILSIINAWKYPVN